MKAEGNYIPLVTKHNQFVLLLILIHSKRLKSCNWNCKALTVRYWYELMKLIILSFFKIWFLLERQAIFSNSLILFYGTSLWEKAFKFAKNLKIKSNLVDFIQNCRNPDCHVRDSDWRLTRSELHVHENTQMICYCSQQQ